MTLQLSIPIDVIPTAPGVWLEEIRDTNIVIEYHWHRWKPAPIPSMINTAPNQLREYLVCSHVYQDGEECGASVFWTEAPAISARPYRRPTKS